MSAEPELLTGLIDDAGLFPPTALSMADALARHRADQRAAEGMLTHRFLCPASRITELRDLLDPNDRMQVGLIADTGLAGLRRARAAIAEDPRLDLAVVEIPIAAAGQAPMTAALDAILAATRDSPVPLFIEPARLSNVEFLAPAVAVRRGDGPLGLKLRCGGVRAALFPSPEDLARALMVAVDAGVPIKATAGLHHAVRHTDPDTGFTHHGFLNLVVAVADAVSGAHIDHVADTLTLTYPGALIKHTTDIGPLTAATVRRTFVAFGSCSTSIPLHEARTLGLWTEKS